ncbi:hypothetical protein V8G54_033074 [Vigna mungo]|uniref:Uncharacterized protein n=1 Tax=Vigna mungo TaxID=3915 RepID=A0AAQ3RHA0_VIGMU
MILLNGPQSFPHFLLLAIQVKFPQVWHIIRNRKGINVFEQIEDGINMFYFFKTGPSVLSTLPKIPYIESNFSDKVATIMPCSIPNIDKAISTIVHHFALVVDVKHKVVGLFCSFVVKP